MSVGILIITHNDIGKQLLETAIAMIDARPLPAQSIEVYENSDPDELLEQAQQAARHLDDGYGLLVLTDIFGSTPSNIANRLLKDKQVNVLSGVNLPMLVRILNYPQLKLNELTEKALSGGKDGILLCNADPQE